MQFPGPRNREDLDAEAYTQDSPQALFSTGPQGHAWVPRGPLGCSHCDRTEAGLGETHAAQVWVPAHDSQHHGCSRALEESLSPLWRAGPGEREERYAYGPPGPVLGTKHLRRRRRLIILCHMLAREAKLWKLLGPCCALPRENNVHGIRMNIN